MASLHCVARWRAVPAHANVSFLSPRPPRVPTRQSAKKSSSEPSPYVQLTVGHKTLESKVSQRGGYSPVVFVCVCFVLFVFVILCVSLAYHFVVMVESQPGIIISPKTVTFDLHPLRAAHTASFFHLLCVTALAWLLI